MRNSSRNNSLIMVVALALGLAVTGCVIIAADGSGFPQTGKDFREDWHKTFPLGPDGRFSLKNVNGNIRISTWDKPEADVFAVKTAKRRAEDLKLVTIESEARPGLRRDRYGLAQDAVPQPAGQCRLRGQGAGRRAAGACPLDQRRCGALGTFGEILAKTTNGDVRLEGASGPAVPEHDQRRHHRPRHPRLGQGRDDQRRHHPDRRRAQGQCRRRRRPTARSPSAWSAPSTPSWRPRRPTAISTWRFPVTIKEMSRSRRSIFRHDRRRRPAAVARHDQRLDSHREVKPTCQGRRVGLGKDRFQAHPRGGGALFISGGRRAPRFP